MTWGKNGIELMKVGSRQWKSPPFESQDFKHICQLKLIVRQYVRPWLSQYMRQIESINMVLTSKENGLYQVVHDSWNWTSNKLLMLNVLKSTTLDFVWCLAVLLITRDNVTTSSNSGIFISRLQEAYLSQLRLIISVYSLRLSSEFVFLLQKICFYQQFQLYMGYVYPTNCTFFDNIPFHSLAHSFSPSSKNAQVFFSVFLHQTLHPCYCNYSFVSYMFCPIPNLLHLYGFPHHGTCDFLFS